MTVRHGFLTLATLAWLGATASLPAHAADAYAAGKKVFTTASPPCAVCHTLQDAGAQGTIGPSLDELKPDSARVLKALRDGIGAMPSFGSSLSATDMAALAEYVSRASGGAR